ncbi:MAG: hypothetical protein HYS12_19430 [Planctomycetes bacterium]|nr:hypothetical protein [Planctomycetota bacterium]
MGKPDGTLSDDCPLDRGTQTRNLLLFAACFGANYLAAPVGYIGVTQASLCKNLGAGETVANLPLSIYLGMTAFPVLIAWLFPQVRQLKRGVLICYAINAASQAAVAVLLVLPLPNAVKIASVIVQAAVAGVVNPAAVMFMWEVVGRGVSEARRGPMMSLTFGAGPVLAALGSLGSHALLNGRLFTLQLSTLEFPWNFAILYALAAPVMALAVLFSAFFIVPLPEREAVREPFLQGIFGGFRNFLTDRVLRWALIVTILVYSANAIPANMTLYAKVFDEPPKQAVVAASTAGLLASPSGQGPLLAASGLNPESTSFDEVSEEHAGLHNTFRFACKAVAGLLFGWLLTRTHPKASLLATAVIFTASVVWALVVTGPWYHAAFLVYGAGELFGAYSPNYILSASRKGDIRRNMAIVTLLMAPAMLQAVLFGMIAEYGGKQFGPTGGFRISFAVCLVLMIAGIVLAALLLPARPAAEDK